LTANVSRVNLMLEKWARPRAVSTGGRSPDPMLDFRGTTMQRFLLLLLTASGAAAIAGCSPSVEQRGNLPSPDKMSEIHAGSTTKEEVAKLLGTPSSVSVFDNDKSWYYISRRTAQTAFFTPDVLDQQVYIVSFDEQGTVRAVDHKELQDGKEITPVARATPAPGRELSFLEQLIGNLGKFNGGGGTTGSSGSDGGQPGPRPNGGK
jgi:outer membrane protein assembly factor BamE (lipoprotein component of BamABCDE complex)